MMITRTARAENAGENADTYVAAPPAAQPDLLPREQMQGSVRFLTGGIEMRTAMRAILLITAAAFGVAAPSVFAQGAPAAGITQQNPVFQRLDSDHDGFISRAEAKQDAAVDAGFDQADTNGDGKLDEDELIKALSIGQRQTVAKVAAEGESEAKQYAVDSEITAKVKAALLRAEGLRSLDVSVQTYKGKVQLAGFVDNKDQIAQAGKLAAREAGVKAVLNDLTLK